MTKKRSIHSKGKLASKSAAKLAKRSAKKSSKAASKYTQDMCVDVGSALLNFDMFKKGRSPAEIAIWTKKDPEYKWVKEVSDQDLLKHLDLHFSILDHEPFLALKFPGPSQGYPATTEDGDTNYFATSFSNFAAKWLRSLKDLRQGGWDDSNRDLKQVFVNALEAKPTLYREATTYKTESHDLLIAHMRSWCITRENEVNKNAHTRAETAAARSGAKSPKPNIAAGSVCA
jgi:hypothetical protein